MWGLGLSAKRYTPIQAALASKLASCAILPPPSGKGRRSYFLRTPLYGTLKPPISPWPVKVSPLTVPE